jgi:hypothetical protein
MMQDLLQNGSRCADVPAEQPCHSIVLPSALLQDQVVYHVVCIMFEMEKLPAPLAPYLEFVDEVGGWAGG